MNKTARSHSGLVLATAHSRRNVFCTAAPHRPGLMLAFAGMRHQVVSCICAAIVLYKGRSFAAPQRLPCNKEASIVATLVLTCDKDLSMAAIPRLTNTKAVARHGGWVLTTVSTTARHYQPAQNMPPVPKHFGC